MTSAKIRLLGEGLTSFIINNQTKFFSEKEEIEAFRSVFFFKTRAKIQS